MPGAINGVFPGDIGNTGDPYGLDQSMDSFAVNEYDFKIKASATDISTYYNQQMKTVGWNGSKTDSGKLLFSNGDLKLIITITPYGGDFNDVDMVLN